MSKVLSTILKWLFIITVPFLLISTSIAFWFNFSPLYNYGYQRFGVENVTGIDKAELARATDEIIDYFNAHDDKDIDIHVIKNNKKIPLFNEIEIYHMRDVKGLVQLDYTIMRILFILDVLLLLILLARNQHKVVSQALIGGSIFTFGFLVVLGLTMAIDFYDFFMLFHSVAFDNDNWLLDPPTDYLIMMYPEGFWVMALLAVLVGIFFMVSILLVTGILLRKKVNAAQN